MKTIVLDAGHGPNTPGKRTPLFSDGTHMKEYEFNSSVVKKLKSMLEFDFNVVITSSDKTDITLSQRVAIEKKSNADLFLSVHANALTGRWGPQNGIETFYNSGSLLGEKYANVIQNGLIKDTGLKNRGAKSAPGPQYASSLYVLKNTIAPAVLVECGFMDNLEEAKLLKSEQYRQLVAESLYNSILEIFGVEKGYKIIGKPTATIKQMKQWARNRKANPLFIDMADTFYDIAVKLGADPVVVYAQSAKETAFFRFGGVIDATYKNTCGLKVSGGGGNYDPKAHMKFDSWEQGITSHVDHLLLYAGAEGYPKPNSPDPRHFAWIKGKAPTVEKLSGNWAPSPTYGESIVNDYIKGILATEVKETDYKIKYKEVLKDYEELKEECKSIAAKLAEIKNILEG